jgi:hypothetical protein
MKVYATGALEINLDKSPKVISQRFLFLFSFFKEAEKAVLNNIDDFFEPNYNYGLIEEHIVIYNSNDSHYDNKPKQWWYKVDRSNNKVVISKIDVPKEYRNISHWWIG